MDINDIESTDDLFDNGACLLCGATVSMLGHIYQYDKTYQDVHFEWHYALFEELNEHNRG